MAEKWKHVSMHWQQGEYSIYMSVYIIYNEVYKLIYVDSWADISLLEIWGHIKMIHLYTRVCIGM